MKKLKIKIIELAILIGALASPFMASAQIGSAPGNIGQGTFFQRIGSAIRLASTSWNLQINDYINFDRSATGETGYGIRSNAGTLEFKNDGGAWTAFGTGSGIEIGGDVTGGTEGSILFIGSGDVLAEDNSKLFWDNTNNRLGIGTSSPASLLHVDAGASTGRVILDRDAGNPLILSFRTDNNPRWAFRVDGTESGSNSGSDLAIRRYSDAGGLVGTPIYIERDTGNIGINNTSPSVLMDILNTSEQLRIGYDASNYYSTTVSSTGGVTFDAVGSGSAFTLSDATTINAGSASVPVTINRTGIGTLLRLESTNVGDNIGFIEYRGSGSRKAFLGFGGAGLVNNNFSINNNTTNGGIILATNNLARMTVDVAGNVGIGTESPTQKLHVNGSMVINAGNSLYFENTTTTYASILGGTSMRLWAGSGTLQLGNNGATYVTLSGNNFTTSGLPYTFTSGTSNRYYAFTSPAWSSGGPNSDVYALGVSGSVTDSANNTWSGLRVAPTFNSATVGSGSVWHGLYVNATITDIGSVGTFALARLNTSANVGITSNTMRGLLINYGFAPTSGTAVNNYMEISPTINQTGGANGITRGLYINPTITAAADFRGIETTAGGAYFNTSSVEASAILQADSTTQGFLPPRMTGAQGEAISSPATGLIIYATDAGSGDITGAGWWGWDGSNWVQL